MPVLRKFDSVAALKSSDFVVPSIKNKESVYKEFKELINEYRSVLQYSAKQKIALQSNRGKNIKK